jgi:hypothetical protein
MTPWNSAANVRVLKLLLTLWWVSNANVSTANPYIDLFKGLALNTSDLRGHLTNIRRVAIASGFLRTADTELPDSDSDSNSNNYFNGLINLDDYYDEYVNNSVDEEEEEEEQDNAELKAIAKEGL